MLAKTGDVVVQKVPVIRLSVFLHFFFVFPFCLLHRLYMGMKQVQEFIMEPKGSGPTEESERLLSQGLFVSHVSAENNCRPRRSEITQPCASGTEKKHFAATEKQCTNSLEGSRKDFLSLPLGHSYLFSFLFLAYDLF
ncbi:AGA_1a_G0000050.mRNA.1.CDS.1 [Saccharomyces cerevisiae]|nr:AGA_1a_G0000050.mRNA.1.CDS.1 [Saccharomyces cerevisiae]CAI6465850.1 AGA_1a_G0000050.mRNA.1.CDS.1 [Saccharomyces cerevisiae]